MTENSSAAPAGAADSARIAGLDRAYTATTNRWGRITLLAGMVLSLSVPFYLYFVSGLDIAASTVLTAFIVVAATYGTFWVVEPLTYYPILGPAGMYQAFMIGNISNKLLPSAIVAQSAIGAKPGTRKGEFAATAAICGAAVIHVVSLLVMVGLLGTWLVSITPESITEVARLYILPSILGGIVVQLIVTLKQLRATIIALVVAGLIVFAVIPFIPVLAPYNTAFAVIITIIITWFARSRKEPAEAAGGQIN